MAHSKKDTLLRQAIAKPSDIEKMKKPPLEEARGT